jgi:two-component system LytT family response regulator
MIRSILVDDEVHNLDLLAILLSRYCPDIEILESVQSINEAYDLIHTLKPDLVFLDVKLLEGTGFDLLRKFNEINFEVIFISGYKAFEKEAFEFNAIDYVVKPIDITRLQHAVHKATKKIVS